MTIKTAHETFLETFNFIAEGKRDHDHAVPFKSEWDNGTGYYNGACTDDLNLPIGSRFCSTSLNNRKIIGVVTPVGNAVFFERCTAGENGVIVTNKPHCLSSLWYDGSQSAETIDRIMGSARGFNKNIGSTLRGVVLEVVTNAERLNAVKAQAKGCTVTVIED
jgi:hypothetical protein